MSHFKWLYVEKIAHDDLRGDSVSEMRMVMRMFVRSSVVNWDEGCSVLVHRKGMILVGVH